MPDLPWSLHPQLAADTMPVGDLCFVAASRSMLQIIHGSSWCRAARALSSLPISAAMPFR